MNTFLEKVVDQLFEVHGDDLHRLCLVLPNRRAGLFLKRYIGKKAEKAVWAPAVYSTEDFVAEISGLTVIDSLEQVFLLYESYRQIEGDIAQSFDDFLKWAPALLKDFSEIDAYMADGEKLFGFVNQARAIETWNPEGTALTEFQKKYLQFWQTLGKYYTAYKEKLLKEKLAYTGLAFHQAAANIESVSQELDWKKVVFIGFNALTRSEEKIIFSLAKAKKAEVFWDADSYYLDNPIHEAGKFLRKHQKFQDSFNWISHNLKKEKKTIEITGASGNISQAKIAGELLDKIGNTDEITKTALVLSDENLLLPVLQSLPEKIEKVNVTMGYPLKKLSLHSFWDEILKLHEHASSFQEQSSSLRFYYKNINNILNHPFVHQIPGFSDAAKDLRQDIRLNNKIFPSWEEIESFMLKKHKQQIEPVRLIFAKNDAFSIIDSFLQLIQYFKDFFTDEEDSNTAYEREQLFHYYKLFNRLATLFGKFNATEKIKTFRRVFDQLAGQQNLPFYGEPLQGLQVMGLLETRNLDFENVILLSANENLLPRGKSNDSFIPADIRRQFGLPLKGDKDAVFAYHFYRLLQRAKNINICYNTEPDELGGGEKSRFITQLQHELPAINPNAEIRQSLLQHTFRLKKSEPLIVEKETSTTNKIAALLREGISPSAINTYINCPLDFYFKYVASLKETEEVEEQIEARTLGNVVHKVLENFYKPIKKKGKVLAVEDVKKMRKSVEEATWEEFRNYFAAHDLKYGKNLLIFKVAVKFIRNFLKDEIAFIDSLSKKGEALTIEDLELNFDEQFASGDFSFRLRGQADRIDRIGNTIRIVDYKTGMVEPRQLNLKSLEDVAADAKWGKALQLLTYALMYRKHMQITTASFYSGNISFRKLSEGFMPVKINNSPALNDEILDEFEKHLANLLKEITDPNIIFQHNSNAAYCKFCDI